MPEDKGMPSNLAIQIDDIFPLRHNSVEDGKYRRIRWSAFAQITSSPQFPFVSLAAIGFIGKIAEDFANVTL